MKKYFLHRGTNPLGPFSVDELTLNEISKDDLVWFEGTPDWRKAGEVEELQQLFIAIPPPLKSYFTPPMQNQFTKLSLHNLNIENIRKSSQDISDITALLVAYKEQYANLFLITIGFNMANKTEHTRTAFIEKLKKERAFEISNIKLNQARYLDEAIAYLCLFDQRDDAHEVYAEISKDNQTQTLLYIDNLITKYNLDMSEEKESIEREERRNRERKEKEEVQKKENAKYRVTNFFGFIGLIGGLITGYIINDAEKSEQILTVSERSQYNTIGTLFIICIILITISIVYPLYVKYIDNDK